MPYLLQSSPARQALSGAALPVPYLPTGNVVGGLPAAILSWCELHAIPAHLLLSVDMVPSLISDTLPALAAAMSQLVQVAAGEVVNSMQLQQQALLGNAKASLERVLRPSSVYV